MSRRFGAVPFWIVAAAMGAPAIALAFAPAPAAAQVGACADGTDFGVGPALLANTEGDRRLGAEISASACSSGHDLRRAEDGALEFEPPEPFPFSWSLGAEGRLSLIHDGRLVPLENFASARAGYSVSLSKPAEPFICPDDIDDEEECARLAAEVGLTEFDYGFLALSARGRYESDLGFDEQHLAAGAELRYGHLRSYIPSIVVTFDAVNAAQSDVRESLGVSDDWFTRWMVQGYLSHGIGPIEGLIEAALFRASGLAPALEALGWDDGEYVAGTLGWLVGWEPFDLLSVDRIYARYTDGRMPALPTGGESWGVGVELGW